MINIKDKHIKEMLQQYRVFQMDYIKANNRKLRIWNREQRRVGEGSARYKELEEIKARFNKHLENVETEKNNIILHIERQLEKEKAQRKAEKKERKRLEKLNKPRVDNITITGPFRSYTPTSTLPPAEKGNEKDPPKVKVVVKKKPKFVVKVKNPNIKDGYDD